MAVLSLAVILSLATDPRCGNAKPGSDFALHVQAVAIHESGSGQLAGDPLIIGVNADPARGLPAAVVRSETVQQAAARARVLLAQGRRVDLGLMQISDRQLARHGLTIEDAFDRCRNMKAGAEHYAGDVQAAIFRMASSRYNTGSTVRGQAYAAGVEAVLQRVRAVEVQPDPGPPAPRRKPSGSLFGRADDVPAADTPGEDRPRLFTHHGG